MRSFFETPVLNKGQRSWVITLEILPNRSLAKGQSTFLLVAWHLTYPVLFGEDVHRLTVPPLRHQPAPTLLLELQQRLVASGGTSSTQPMLQYIPGENGQGLGENLPKVLWVGQNS